MALLQISEPGQAPDPHERRIAIGIDLGTTHSLVASVRHGVPTCLPDNQGRVVLPSVVRYLNAEKTQIGFEALKAQVEDPKNTISSVKRLMGRRLSDIQHQETLPYDMVDGPGMLTLKTVAGDKTPVEISAEILATLRQRAEDTFNQKIYGAVITVPAYFDDAQRQATKDAARLAGLNVLRLINEPTAAAMAYGLDKGSEGLFAIYDLGGGTFDISILKLTRGIFEVLATAGDAALGGDDYDHALAHWLLTQAGLAQEFLDAADKAKLLQSVRAAKESLSTLPSITFKIELKNSSIDLPLTASDFDAVGAELTAKTMATVKTVLRDAKLAPEQINGVVLVGGATRMPQIHRAVRDFFASEPLIDLNPDEIVALGACISAHQLAGNTLHEDVLLLDVIALSLGLETMGGIVERIIPRNQTLPTAMAQDFTTYQDGQTALALHVVQGERDLVADCRSLARFELRGIPPMPAGAARIRVIFTVDADGLLHVHAQELGSGVEAQTHVKPAYGLSDEDIARLLEDSFKTAQQDMQARALSQARVDADRLLLAVQTALAADADLLSETEKQAIANAMHHLKQTKDQANTSPAIEEAHRVLSSVTEAFAAERMNRHIQQALTGRHIAKI